MHFKACLRFNGGKIGRKVINQKDSGKQHMSPDINNVNDQCTDSSCIVWGY